MGDWVLIVAMWAGTFAKGDSVALVSVSGFHNREGCESAGRSAIGEFTTTFKTVKFICVQK